MQICHEIFVHNTLVTLSYRLKTHKQFARIVTVKSPTLTQTQTADVVNFREGETRLCWLFGICGP